MGGRWKWVNCPRITGPRITVPGLPSPDYRVRNDPLGNKPWDNVNDRPNVTWNPHPVTDVVLVGGAPPQDVYDPQDFGEYCTSAAIYDAQIRNLLNSIEKAYAKPTSKFSGVTQLGDKPVVLIGNAPDITNIPMLLPVNKNVQTIGRLPFYAAHPDVSSSLVFLEKIRYKIGSKATHTYGAKARVSLLAVLEKATGPGSYFDTRWETGSARTTKKDLLEGDAWFPVVELEDKDVLSDAEIDFIKARKTALDAKLAKVSQDNLGGKWPHLRVVIVDTDGAFATIPKGFSLGPTGGLFSLDFVHPNSQGQKLLANQYIKAVNSLIAKGEFFGLKKQLQAPAHSVP